jgi:exopolysaccharide production protein ExoZ
MWWACPAPPCHELSSTKQRALSYLFSQEFSAFGKEVQTSVLSLSRSLRWVIAIRALGNRDVQVIRPIQYLRGIAAIMVVWHNCLWQIPALSEWLPINPGAAALNLFFVISGFVIAYSTAAEPISAGRFLALRVIRIVPLYLAATLLLAALRHFMPLQFGFSFFTQEWTLNYEAIFYALFGLSLATAGKWLLKAVALALCVLTAIGLKFGPLAGAPFIHGDVRLLAFVAGMMIAWLTEPASYLAEFVGVSRSGKATFALRVLGDGMDDPSGRLSFPAGSTIIVGDPSMEARPKWVRLGSASIAAAIVCLTFVNSSWLLLIGSALIVAASIALPLKDSKLLLALGNASYSIFLTNLFTVNALRVLWSSLGFPATMTGALVLLILSLAASAAVGLLCYRFLEKPLTAWLRGAVIRAAEVKAAAGHPAPPVPKRKLLY